MSSQRISWQIRRRVCSTRWEIRLFTISVPEQRPTTGMWTWLWCVFERSVCVLRRAPLENYSFSKNREDWSPESLPAVSQARLSCKFMPNTCGNVQHDNTTNFHGNMARKAHRWLGLLDGKLKYLSRKVSFCGWSQTRLKRIASTSSTVCSPLIHTHTPMRCRSGSTHRRVLGWLQSTGLVQMLLLYTCQTQEFHSAPKQEVNALVSCLFELDVMILTEFDLLGANGAEAELLSCRYFISPPCWPC